jgi:chaperonin GroEL (HSP60 family)
MIDEVIKWMDEDVDDLMVEYGIEGTPKLDGIILDEDATTDAVVDQKRSDRRFHDALKSSRAAKQQGGYCSDMRARPCCNHMAKNCGGYAKEKGMALHTSCSCSIKLTCSKFAY